MRGQRVWHAGSSRPRVVNPYSRSYPRRAIDLSGYRAISSTVFDRSLTFGGVDTSTATTK